MAALPPVSKVLRVAVPQSMTDEAKPLLNRYFLSYTGTAPTDAELHTFADAIMATWVTYMAGLQPDDCVAGPVQVEDLTSATSAVGVGSNVAAGTRGATGFPVGVATCLSFKIARRYRGGHPRMYLYAGEPADQATPNTWSSTYLAAVDLAASDFFSTHLASGWSGAGSLEHVNVSYYEGFTNHTYPSGRVRPIPTPRGTPLVDTIVAWETNTNICSMRKRNAKGSDR